MERVTIKSGQQPIVFVAPHGYDDENTGLIAYLLAKNLDCYAVINNCWERDDHVDCMKDKADCNNVSQCHEDVVREEFLDPILRYKTKILRSFAKCYIFYIHGMSCRHKQIDQNMHIVIGHGSGNPDSLSCSNWEMQVLYNSFEDNNFNTYIGSAGGPMSGWSKNNLNQLFRKWYPDQDVSSTQIEIMYDLRKTVRLAKRTAINLSGVFKDFFKQNNFNKNTIKYY